MTALGTLSRPVMAAEGQVERVRLHRVSRTLAFADVRLPWVHLTGLPVEENASGRLTVTAPERLDRHGCTRPIYSLQPVAREAIEREIGVLWARD